MTHIKMHKNLKERAVERVKLAIREDVAGNYGKAFPLYMSALECFQTYLRHEKDPKIKAIITRKSIEYLRRAEEIRLIPDARRRRTASRGSASVPPQARAKGKPNGGEKEEDRVNRKRDTLAALLSSTIVRERPNVKWSDVAGLESVKRALQEAVILPVKFPQFFTGNRRPWSAFLLYGPPGTGKSYIAKAVATEADSTFFSISSSDLVSKWLGESEKLVSNLFQMARESAPSIIFIDEIDSLCGQRGEGNETEASRRVKTELLVQMQGVGNSNQRVLVLAATNTPYDLDQAIRRRFDKRIYIPLPDLNARQHMFKANLGDTSHNLTDLDFEHLAHKTEGFSGSDISVCVNEVLFEPVRKTKDAKFFRKDSNRMWVPCGPNERGAIQITMQELDARGFGSKVLPPPLTRADFNKVLSRQKPTVSKSDLDVHEQFTMEFGEKADSEMVGIEASKKFPMEIEDEADCFFGAEGAEVHRTYTKELVCDIEAYKKFPMEMEDDADCFFGSEDAEVHETFTKELVGNIEAFKNFPMEDEANCFSRSENVEVHETFTEELVGNADCLHEEGKNDFKSLRLIMNVGIAICILVYTIPMFLR